MTQPPATSCHLCGATGVLICHDARCPRTGQREIREIDACEAGSREAYFAHDTQEDQPMTDPNQPAIAQIGALGQALSRVAALEKKVSKQDQRIATLTNEAETMRSALVKARKALGEEGDRGSD